MRKMRNAHNGVGDLFWREHKVHTVTGDDDGHVPTVKQAEVSCCHDEPGSFVLASNAACPTRAVVLE